MLYLQAVEGRGRGGCNIIKALTHVISSSCGGKGRGRGGCNIIKALTHVISSSCGGEGQGRV